MDNVNGSTSETNIIVDYIKDLNDSPHSLNKEAYILRMGKWSNSKYSSRFGFNMYKLPKSAWVQFIVSNEMCYTCNGSGDIIGCFHFIEYQPTIQ